MWKKKYILISLTVLSMLLINSCRSYQMVPNGYTVEGDEYFINVDRGLSVCLGEDMLREANWQGNVSPINVNKVGASFVKVLKYLHYPDTAYSVLFTGHLKGKYDYDLVAAVNNYPNRKGEKSHLLDLTALQREESKVGRYFYRVDEFKGKKLLHFVIPIHDQLWQEKMLSMIFILPSDFSDMDWAKNMVLSNVAMYRTRYVFNPSRTEILCADDANRSHVDYKIPEGMINTSGYMLMKAYGQVNGKRTLIVYRLMQPNASYGSFVVCKGEYEIRYTTLDDQAVWQTTVHTENNVIF